METLETVRTITTRLCSFHPPYFVSRAGRSLFLSSDITLEFVPRSGGCSYRRRLNGETSTGQIDARPFDALRTV